MNPWRNIIRASQTEKRSARNVGSQGFVPVPEILLGGLTAEQMAWHQQVYAQAIAEARARLTPKLTVPAFPREARN